MFYNLIISLMIDTSTKVLEAISNFLYNLVKPSIQEYFYNGNNFLLIKLFNIVKLFDDL